jgi:hypothetical protein
MVARSSVPALEPVVVSFNAYNSSSELLSLLSALQQLAAGEIKISVCSYGSEQVWLTLVPKAEALYGVIDLIVEQFTVVDENEGRLLCEKRSLASICCVASILETAQRMLK